MFKFIFQSPPMVLNVALLSSRSFAWQANVRSALGMPIRYPTFGVGMRHNTIKHAGATQVAISITVTDRLEVIIEDNGRGLEEGKTSTLGNGLRNMQRRLQQAGGICSIGSTLQGTRVVLTAPLPV